MDELYVIGKRENRQAQIDNMDIGDTISIAQRVELTYGLPEGALAKITQRLRGSADQQANRARKTMKDRSYRVENGSFMTREGALMIVVAVTRVE